MCDPCCPPACCGELKRCKSRELRAGVFYMGCDCVYRNGLQDRCPLSNCQGRCECVTFPQPSCCASETRKKRQCQTMGRPAYGAKRCPPACCPPSCCPSKCPGPCPGPCPAPKCPGPCPAPCPCPPTSSCAPGLSGLNCALNSYGCCGQPVPIPPMCSSGCCPPLKEAGAPDPCLWKPCKPPRCYPCYI